MSLQDQDSFFRDCTPIKKLVTIESTHLFYKPTVTIFLMKIWVQITAVFLLFPFALLFSACGGGAVETASTETAPPPTVPVNSTATPEPSPSPKIPNLQ